MRIRSDSPTLLGLAVTIIFQTNWSDLSPVLGVLALPNPSLPNSTPLLLGPPGSPDDDSDQITASVSVTLSISGTSAATTASYTSSSTTISTTDSSSDTASVDPTSPITSSTTATPTTTASTTTSTSTDTSNTTPAPPFDVRFLTPLFVLIGITLLGWVYGKWRNRRNAVAAKELNDGDPFINPQRGQWKQINHQDEFEKGYNENDPWYAGDDDHCDERMGWKEIPLSTNQNIQPSNSKWGLRDTFTSLTNWQRGERGNSNQQARTVRLVAPKTAVSYQTLPDIGYSTAKLYSASRSPDDMMDQEDMDSYSSLKAQVGYIGNSTYLSLESNTNMIPPTPNFNIQPQTQLSRNRAPNKRLSATNSKAIKTRSKSSEIPAPTPPDWIHPRATSPTNFPLSPPLNPNLFFQSPISPTNGTQPQGLDTEGSESGSDYGSDDDDTSQLNQSGDQRGQNRSSMRAIVNGGGLEESYTAPPKIGIHRNTPSRSRSNVTPNKKIGKLNPETPTTMKRSTGIRGIDSALNTESEETPRRKKSATGGGQQTQTPTVTISARKSRRLRKEEKVREEVEDIIKASWSDRGFVSPPVGGVGGIGGERGGWMIPQSPGVEEAEILGGGGIEQRLAKLRQMEG